MCGRIEVSEVGNDILRPGVCVRKLVSNLLLLIRQLAVRRVTLGGDLKLGGYALGSRNSAPIYRSLLRVLLLRRTGSWSSGKQ